MVETSTTGSAGYYLVVLFLAASSRASPRALSIHFPSATPAAPLLVLAALLPLLEPPVPGGITSHALRA